MLYPIKTIWGKERNRAAGNNLKGENELELNYFKCDTDKSVHFTSGKAEIIFVVAVGAMIGLGLSVTVNHSCMVVCGSNMEKTFFILLLSYRMIHKNKVFLAFRQLIRKKLAGNLNWKSALMQGFDESHFNVRGGFLQDGIVFQCIVQRLSGMSTKRYT